MGGQLQWMVWKFTFRHIQGSALITFAPAVAIFIPAVGINGQAGGHKLERMVRPENACDYLAQPVDECLEAKKQEFVKNPTKWERRCEGPQLRYSRC